MERAYGRIKANSPLINSECPFVPESDNLIGADFRTGTWLGALQMSSGILGWFRRPTLACPKEVPYPVGESHWLSMEGSGQ